MATAFIYFFYFCKFKTEAEQQRKKFVYFQKLNTNKRNTR